PSPTLSPILFCDASAPPDPYTLSLHDALPILSDTLADFFARAGFPRERILPIYYGFDADLFPFRERGRNEGASVPPTVVMHGSRSEEHTSELQSPYDLVCRLLLEKKK